MAIVAAGKSFRLGKKFIAAWDCIAHRKYLCLKCEYLERDDSVVVSLFVCVGRYSKSITNSVLIALALFTKSEVSVFECIVFLENWFSWVFTTLPFFRPQFPCFRIPFHRRTEKKKHIQSSDTIPSINVNMGTVVKVTINISLVCRQKP